MACFRGTQSFDSPPACPTRPQGETPTIWGKSCSLYLRVKHKVDRMWVSIVSALMPIDIFCILSSISTLWHHSSTWGIGRCRTLAFLLLVLLGVLCGKVCAMFATSEKHVSRIESILASLHLILSYSERNRSFILSWHAPMTSGQLFPKVHEVGLFANFTWRDGIRNFPELMLLASWD